MSFEEDSELRDLLTQTLESNGTLAKLRAQLRACVFFAFDENELLQKNKFLLNKKVKAQLETSEGKLMFCLVREFLEYFNLDYTISVYDPESYSGNDYTYEGRSKLVQELNLNENDAVPLLLQLINLAKNNPKLNGSKTDNDDISENISESQLGEIKDNSQHMPVERLFNKTFDVSNPTINDVIKNVNSPRSIETASTKNDTMHETSSIEEEEEASFKDQSPIDFEKSIKSDKCDSPGGTKMCTLLDLDKSIKSVRTEEISESNKSCLIDFDKSIRSFRSDVVTETKSNSSKHSLDLLTNDSISKHDENTPIDVGIKIDTLFPLAQNHVQTREIEENVEKSSISATSTSISEIVAKSKSLESHHSDAILLPLTNNINQKADIKVNYDDDVITESEVEASVQRSSSNQHSDRKENGAVEIEDSTANESTASSVTSEDIEFNSNLDDIFKSSSSN